jgi:hypothetical protein
MVGAQIVIIAVGVIEIGRRAGHPIGAGLAWAAPELILQADWATATREKIGKGNAIPFPQRLTIRVGGDAGAEALNSSAHLVAEGQVFRGSAVDIFHLAPPDMEI